MKEELQNMNQPSVKIELFCCNVFSKGKHVSTKMEKLLENIYMLLSYLICSLRDIYMLLSYLICHWNCAWCLLVVVYIENVADQTGRASGSQSLITNQQHCLAGPSFQISFHWFELVLMVLNSSVNFHFHRWFQIWDNVFGNMD